MPLPARSKLSAFELLIRWIGVFERFKSLLDLKPLLPTTELKPGVEVSKTRRSLLLGAAVSFQLPGVLQRGPTFPCQCKVAGVKRSSSCSNASVSRRGLDLLVGLRPALHWPPNARFN